MTQSFSALKKARTSSFESLNSQLQKMASGGYANDDENYWKLEVDKAGNGYAVIRFLPAPTGEDIPFVQMWDHGFQGPGGWYIENSLTTLGKPDPVSEYNSQLWNSGIEANKELARKYKRRLSYIANIYVVTDIANPQNEGKVFLFKFGKKIFDRVNNAMNPEYADEVKFNPFDLWEGADFKLKARNGDGGYRTYEASSFAAQRPLSNARGEALSDDQLEEIWKKEHSLQEIVDAKNFKSYNELKAHLYKVLGLDGGARTPTNTAEQDEGMDFSPKFKERQAPALDETPSPLDDAEELEFFKNLAIED